MSHRSSPSAQGPNRRRPSSRGLQRGRLGAEPQVFNYSGLLTSDPIKVLPGSTYALRFKSSWMGNWTGAFTAVVSLYQYKSLDEIVASENPTNPMYPFTLSFVPCRNGDAGHCEGQTKLPTLPVWTDLTTNFMTVPDARYIRIRSYVGSWGAGQASWPTGWCAV